MRNKFLAGALFVSLLAVFSPVPRLLAQQPSTQEPPQGSGSEAAPEQAAPLSPRELKIERAKIFLATKRYEASIQEYKELLKSEPRNALYLNMIGINYLNLSNLGQAKKYFQRSAKADRKYSSPVNNLGMVWYQRKNYKKAIREYRKAIAIDPGQSGPYGNLGFAYYNAKKFPQAAEAFRKALEIDPRAFERNARVGTMMQDRSVSNRGMFNYMMAREYANLGNAEKCAEYLRRAFDEGYPEVAKAKTDSAFAKVLTDPGVQEVLQRIPATRRGAASPNN